MWSKWCKINVSYLGGLWDSTVQVSLHSDQYNASKMENVGDAPSKSGVHRIIRGNDIHCRLCNVFGEGNIMFKLVVYQWIQRFDAGGVTTKGKSRAGRPRNSFNDDTIAYIHIFLDKDDWYTVTDFHCEMVTYFLNNASHSQVYGVLIEALEIRKVCAAWVPKELSNVHRSNHMASALELLTWYECEGFNFLKHTVTRDESWLHYWISECKAKSRVWETVEEKVSRKFKITAAQGQDSWYQVLGLSSGDHD